MLFTEWRVQFVSRKLLCTLWANQWCCKLLASDKKHYTTHTHKRLLFSYTCRISTPSVTQLLPVIQQLAEDETDEIIKNRYNIIITLINKSITAMNTLTSPHTLHHNTSLH